MAGYSTYISVRDNLVRGLGHLVGKHERRKPEFVENLVRMFLSEPGGKDSLEAEILADETGWLESGAKTYFPESPDLLKTLWRARMDVTMEDMCLDSFPKVFSVAWPNVEINGVRPQGCLVTVGMFSETISSLERFWKRYVAPTKILSMPGFDTTRPVISVMFAGDEVAAKMRPMLRAVVPAADLEMCLSSGKDFEKVARENLMRPRPGMMPLTEKDFQYQYTVVKLLIHLMVYMRACPEAVVDGYPDGRREKEFKSRWMDKITPTVISFPKGLSGSHESPMAHWRDWHFRSYPKKRDGTKKAGTVFVRGTMVNARLDPATVEVVEWKGVASH